MPTETPTTPATPLDPHTVPAGRSLTMEETLFLAERLRQLEGHQLNGWIRTETDDPVLHIGEASRLVTRFPELAPRLCPILALAHHQGCLAEKERTFELVCATLATLQLTPNAFNVLLFHHPLALRQLLLDSYGRMQRPPLQIPVTR